MKFKDIYKKIESYDNITIFGHVTPDGDCYGSQTGLALALKEMYPNKNIKVVGLPFVRKPDFLPEIEPVEDGFIASSLAFVLDVANEARIGDQRYKLAQAIIKIDHHILQDEFGVISWVNTDKVATCQMITELLQYKQTKINYLAASCLYLGLVTDSGRFMYSPITSELFESASYLLKSGAKAKEIYDKLYEVDPIQLRFKGYIYLNYKISPEGVAYCYFDKECLKDFNMDFNQAASLVNTIANIKGTRCWVFFAESNEGEVRVELRSNGFPVQPVAVTFGGGGHECAAGCKLSSINDYIKVVEELDRVLKEYNK